MGGSTPVDLKQRLPVWLETVPALLQHLNIKHVSLASHSAGTVYLLNTLYHFPHLLEPENPRVALLGMSPRFSCQMRLMICLSGVDIRKHPGSIISTRVSN
jgi:hypothetical protein